MLRLSSSSEQLSVSKIILTSVFFASGLAHKDVEVKFRKMNVFDVVFRVTHGAPHVRSLEISWNFMHRYRATIEVCTAFFLKVPQFGSLKPLPKKLNVRKK